MQFLKKPTRTCISCRGKFDQATLLRLQCKDKKILPFSGNGRSFYLCEDCCDNISKVVKSIYRQCKNKAEYEQQLEEMVKEWKTK
jgi:predicted RNA-binding protein YlxR (DUF448 family)